MQCQSNPHVAHHGCHCAQMPMALWSKRQKLEYLKHLLEGIRKQEKDIREAINEIK